VKGNVNKKTYQATVDSIINIVSKSSQSQYNSSNNADLNNTNSTNKDNKDISMNASTNSTTIIDATNTYGGAVIIKG
jgi:hypothetical protein